jgi:hypothetical protein
LQKTPPGLEWIQVEVPLSDPDAWAVAAQGKTETPLDVVLRDPGLQYGELYRLVDVCAVHDVRLSIPGVPGFLKAVRLAASLRIPVRILPGQPGLPVLAELMQALKIYLHEPMIETPVEFFHSILANRHGADTGSLWMILEEDPKIFPHYDIHGNIELPRSKGLPEERFSPETFVRGHLERLVEEEAECVECPWQTVCGGYFKWPDHRYSCAGVKDLLSMIEAAAGEIAEDLAGFGTAKLI